MGACVIAREPGAAQVIGSRQHSLVVLRARELKDNWRTDVEAGLAGGVTGLGRTSDSLFHQ